MAARRPSLPTTAPNGPSARRLPLMRAGRPVRRAAVITIPGVSFTRKPAGTSSLTRPYEPSTVMYPSGSARSPDASATGTPGESALEGSTRETNAASAPISRPSSSATAVNTSAGRAPLATSVATRRSAACSSASWRGRASSGWSRPGPASARRPTPVPASGVLTRLTVARGPAGRQRGAAGAARLSGAKLLLAGHQYLDLALPHSRAEHGQLAVAGIGALACQRVELPLVVRAGQRGPVEV